MKSIQNMGRPQLISLGKKVLISVGALGALGVLATMGWFGYQYYQLHRYDPPNLPFPDLSVSGVAAHVAILKGEGYWRFLNAEDLDDSEYFFRDDLQLPPQQKEGWTQITKESKILLGSMLVLSSSSVKLKTHGKWQIQLDYGQHILEDARRDDVGKKHVVKFFVRNGQLRAKSYGYDSDKYWLEIRTKVARIIIHNGEIGLRISGNTGRGQIWLMSGFGVVYDLERGTMKILSAGNLDNI